MARGKNGLAKLAIIISAFTFVITVIGVYFSYNQLKLSNDQLKLSNDQVTDLREQFDRSGAVLSVETSAQLRYKDGRQPVTLSEQEHPTLTGPDFDTPGAAIYLVYKVTNTGRLDTTLLGADLRIGDTTIKGDDPLVKSLCAAQGGGELDCRPVFAAPVRPKLEPGWTYYFYFPLTGIREKLKIGAGLQGEIDATGLRAGAIQFPLGISVSQQG